MIKKELIGGSYETIAERANIFNPFGPHFLYLKLQKKLRQDLLKIVNDIRSDKEERKRGDDKKDPKWNKELKASIHNGESYGISYNMDKKHGSILNYVLRWITSIYTETHPDNVEIFEAWYVIMKQGDFHMLHSHEGAGREFSGSIYLEVPDNLEFPQGNITWIMGNSDQTMRWSHYSHIPKVGDCFIWPAWLKHDVYPFRSEQERVMISFNTGIIDKENHGNKDS